MKNRVFFVIMFVFIFYTKVNSQTFDLGFNLGLGITSTDARDKYSSVIPPELILKSGIKLNKFLNFDLRAGWGYETDSFNGFRIGITDKLYFSDSIYGIVGYNHYFNNGGELGHSTSVKEGTFSFIIIGIGTKISKSFFTELNTQLNLSGDKNTRIGVDSQKGYREIYNIIKLNFGFEWEL